MYGLIIDGLRYLTESHFSRDVWLECLKIAGIRNENFSSHERYSERLAPNVLSALCQVTGKSAHDVGVLAGAYFIKLMAVYDYDKLLKVLGRRFTDFVRGLDNLHEYFRLSYPKIRPPSFYCEREDSKGLVLHYRSRRTGYMSYVHGQLEEIAKTFYDMSIKISVNKKEVKKGILYSVLRVDFDNSEHKDDRYLKESNKSHNEFLRVDAVGFLGMFPFYIVFNKNMTIQLVGEGLEQLLPDLNGKKLTEEFELVRPVIKFTWEGVAMHSNNIFKLQSLRMCRRKAPSESMAVRVNDVLEEKIEVQRQREEAAAMIENTLLDQAMGLPVMLKGQMLKIRKSEVFMYLATCEVENLDQMYDLGACVSDYSISDCNRDMIMTTVQQSDDLKALLKNEREKSQKLNQVLRLIEIERRQAKRLLAQKMPKNIAEYLTSISALDESNVCEAHPDVSVLCLKLVDLEDTIYGWSPAEIVTMLNQYYSVVDAVAERNGVYKVENVMDTGMLVCGINPKTPHHAEYLSDAALELLQEFKKFTTLRTNTPIAVKIGMYTGTVLAGVVGIKSPRYCVMGDVVLCAGKLEGICDEPNTARIGDTVYDALQEETPDIFTFLDKGIIRLKGKGKINTYELVSKTVPPRSNVEPLQMADEMDHSDDDEDLEDQYTPVEQMESSMSSQASRMSISRSLYGSSTAGSRVDSAMSHAVSYRSNSQHSDRSGSESQQSHHPAVEEDDVHDNGDHGDDDDGTGAGEEIDKALEDLAGKKI